MNDDQNDDDDFANEEIARILRDNRRVADVLRRQHDLLEARGVAREMVTSAALGVAIARLLEMKDTEKAIAWLAGIARFLAGERDTAGSA